MGDLRGANPYYERALAIAETSLVMDHSNPCIFRGILEGRNPLLETLGPNIST